jgi:hypothetical protein
MSTHQENHLAPEEVELWAEGLLPAARALHLPQCPACLATADEARRFFVALANLERPAPSEGFAERVMARVQIPHGSARAPKG